MREVKEVHSVYEKAKNFGCFVCFGYKNSQL